MSPDAVTTDETDAPALSVNGLSFSYPDKPEVLRHIDITVMSGERVGVIGPNGSGKTTLFLMICGALAPSAGEIKVMGRPVVEGRFSPDIGLVFQNPDDQLFCPSVRDDVAFGPENMKLTAEEVTARVDEALAVTGVAVMADRPPHHLSGGEKRMAAIAAVLAMRPALMLYDEPSASLDIRSRRQLINLLKASAQTILVSSHDLEFILEVCDRVIIIDNQGIAADGHPREIMGDEALMRAHGQEKPHSLMPHRGRPHDGVASGL
ncbi:ABC transporter related protein [Dehalogenimonas lykanthroporepellens BL-DC-9]|nr:ABC transporter related protein [Dehalogenimonas lykanthroporepellens BL-DC-9]